MRAIKPKGNVVSKSAAGRELKVPRQVITAWVIAEGIETHEMINGKAHGIDERGMAKLRRLAEAYHAEG